MIDSDGDNISDDADRCNNYNDSIDVDFDGIPDGCDEMIDSDNDGTADEFDRCPESDDSIDLDADSIPDGCDDSIDLRSEEELESNAFANEDLRAGALIFVLVLVAFLLIAMIRRGKPPTVRKYSEFSEKEHIKF